MTARTSGQTTALAAHAHPHWNVADEPWIPLHTDSGITHLGLRDLFLSAHTLGDIAESDPLTRAALRRLLEDLTAAIVRANPDLPWRDYASGNTGFPEDVVNTLLASIHDHLYLYHPVTPFLQDLRLTIHDPERRGEPDASFSALLPYLPGLTEAAWSYKHTDPAFTDGLTLPEAARALVARRVYGTPGNGGGGDRGGTYTEGPATITHVFRVNPTSLFCTLLRNLTPGLLTTQPGQPSGLAWLTGGYQANGDDLYQSSLTVTQTLLGPPVGGHVHTVLRASLGNKDIDKLVRDTARDIDRHAIIERQPTKPKRIRLTPEDHPLKRLHSLLTVTAGTNPVTGVLLDGNLWLTNLTDHNGAVADTETLELLLASKAGQASSPKYRHTLTIRLQAFHLTPRWAPHQLVLTLLSAAFAKGGALPKLRYAVSTALSSDARTTQAVTDWMGRMHTLVSRAEQGRLSIADAATLPAQEAIAAYDQATALFAGQTSMAARIANARRPLVQAAYPRKDPA